MTSSPTETFSKRGRAASVPRERARDTSVRRVKRRRARRRTDATGTARGARPRRYSSIVRRSPAALPRSGGLLKCPAMRRRTSTFPLPITSMLPSTPPSPRPMIGMWRPPRKKCCGSCGSATEASALSSVERGHSFGVPGNATPEVGA